jgi:cytochrome c553
MAAGLLAGMPVSAQDVTQNEERQRLLALIAQANGDPADRERAIRRGRERITFCSHCHGEDGNSKRPDIPNLAGQNPAYLLEQFDAFVEGRRKDFVMQTLAKEFTMEDKINISVYFSSQKVKSGQEIDARAAERGKVTFTNVCQFCHGADGRGEVGYARLAGQQKQYVINTLKRYRDNANAERREPEVRRTNPRMEQVTQKLTDEEIRAVANYVASLGGP